MRPFVEITDSVKGYIQKDDSFFYVLGYNPETRYGVERNGQSYEIKIHMLYNTCWLVVIVQIDTGGCGIRKLFSPFLSKVKKTLN